MKGSHEIEYTAKVPVIRDTKPIIQKHRGHSGRLAQDPGNILLRYGKIKDTANPCDVFYFVWQGMRESCSMAPDQYLVL